MPAKYLVGFSSALDWRPLDFVDPDRYRSCSLCNVVPQETFQLECSHVLCGVCYQDLLRCHRRCPLDGEEFRENDVRTFSHRVSLVKVRCCNFRSGCDFVGTLAEIEKHFFNECTFHAVACTGCNAEVLRRDIASHFSERRCKSDNSRPGTIPAGEHIYEMGRKIDTSLDTLTGMVSSIEDKLNAYIVAMGDAKDSIETLKDCVTSTGHEVRLIKEKVDNEEVLLRAVAQSACKEAYFHVRDFGRIRSDQKQSFYTVFPASDISNVCGYSTELRLAFNEGPGTLYTRVCFRRASEQSRLKWPSSIDIAFVLVHPYDQSKNIERFLNHALDGGPICYWSFNDPLLSPSYVSTSFELEDIEKGGFIRHDSICVGIKIR